MTGCDGRYVGPGADICSVVAAVHGRGGALLVAVIDHGSLSGLTERLDAGLARLEGIDWFGQVG